jgi:hypothetical protein
LINVTLGLQRSERDPTNLSEAINPVLIDVNSGALAISSRKQLSSAILHHLVVLLAASPTVYNITVSLLHWVRETEATGDEQERTNCPIIWPDNLMRDL